MTPLLLYIYLFFPESNIYETPFFTISTKYYEDVQALIWTSSIKVVFILMFSIWYITCRHWWRICLIIPIIFFVNQLIVVVNDELQYADEYELGISLIISIPILLIIIILSKKLKYYSEAKSIAEDLDTEINQIFENAVKIKNKNLRQIKTEIKNLKSQKANLSKEEYLKKLIRMRDQLD